MSIHDKILDVSGGLAGVMDEGLIRGPLEFIKDDSYYPTFSSKITHLVYSLVKNHGFKDGNKRTALVGGGFLLILNGYDEYIEYYFTMFEQVMVLMAKNLLTKKELETLIKDIVDVGQLSESSLLMIISRQMSPSD